MSRRGAELDEEASLDTSCPSRARATAITPTLVPFSIASRMHRLPLCTYQTRRSRPARPATLLGHQVDPRLIMNGSPHRARPPALKLSPPARPQVKDVVGKPDVIGRCVRLTHASSSATLAGERMA
jgi:hypothetical protein